MKIELTEEERAVLCLAMGAMMAMAGYDSARRTLTPYGERLMALANKISEVKPQ